MTQLTEHAKTILRAIADGKQIECGQVGVPTAFFHCEFDDALATISVGNAGYLRIKPETRSINGVEFAAPNLGGSGYPLIAEQIHALQQWRWPEAKDRDTAYQAFVDALEGKNHV